ncbi:class I SAM-dependent RNA methyltransferase [Actinoplanes sp. N902-109]|uniref:class I SAM-dependent RNA methyltransferase n=1 Tax=Actinoplanes sp. (strain N902-109) TaxID=649831 RepID=UPI0003294612|nr:TRAM domain-containing protein [Actinoplanes sp. N902-109]AGL20195.1 deoxyribonuclease/rho domain-containing protein [Actinoplanes sp. N902-109]
MSDDLVQGDRVEVTVGAPAHGGHCVARIGGEHGRVVFVRHALPGERVTAEITELHKGWLRADAVVVHEASPDRVEPPCPWARPGACGGCDLQHVTPAAQLDWKTEVVRDLLTRMGGLSEVPVRVEPLPGGPLGWRSRIRYAVDAADRPGLLKHRSHEVVPIDWCRIARPELQKLDITSRTWPEVAAVEAVASTGGDVVVLPRSAGPVQESLLDEVAGPSDGSAEVRERAAGREWHVPAEGFWQIHPAAADTLVTAVLELLDPQPGETSWDLYGGAGLFAAALSARTGARTVVVESSAPGVAAARRNLADLTGVEVVAAKVDVALSRRRIAGPVDLVVLDPPRTGAGAKVVRGVAASGARAVAYVACDPAALARDVRTFGELGWEVAALRAYDCFPMTQHVECVALLTPPAQRQHR